MDGRSPATTKKRKYSSKKSGVMNLRSNSCSAFADNDKVKLRSRKFRSGLHTENKAVNGTVTTKSRRPLQQRCTNVTGLNSSAPESSVVGVCLSENDSVQTPVTAAIAIASNAVISNELEGVDRTIILDDSAPGTPITINDSTAVTPTKHGCIGGSTNEMPGTSAVCVLDSPIVISDSDEDNSIIPGSELLSIDSDSGIPDQGCLSHIPNHFLDRSPRSNKKTTPNKRRREENLTDVCCGSSRDVGKIVISSESEDESATPLRQRIEKKRSSESSVGRKKSVSGPTCPICWSSLDRNRPKSSTPCGHCFCTPCIEEAINRYQKCPVCCKKITLKGLRPLFL